MSDRLWPESGQCQREKLRTGREMRTQSLLQTLLSYLVAEHLCAPPDTATPWLKISEQAAKASSAETYTCPECGQHMARSERLKKAA